MTNATKTAPALATAYSNLTAAQDAYQAPCHALKLARAALGRSKSQKNFAAYQAAVAASDAALEVCDAAHEALATAEDDHSVAQDAAEAAEAAALEPTFF